MGGHEQQHVAPGRDAADHAPERQVVALDVLEHVAAERRVAAGRAQLVGQRGIRRVARPGQSGAGIAVPLGEARPEIGVRLDAEVALHAVLEEALDEAAQAASHVRDDAAHERGELLELPAEVRTRAGRPALVELGVRLAHLTLR